MLLRSLKSLLKGNEGGVRAGWLVFLTRLRLSSPLKAALEKSTIFSLVWLFVLRKTRRLFDTCQHFQV